jgi:phosphoribulokinase
MPDKVMRMARSAPPANGLRRPVVMAIAGDSAAGKTTLTRGLIEAIGPDRCIALCVDDYHRYDRAERTGLPFTPLHPECNYVDIMEQHLQLLATGQPILKPVYDHGTGQLTRPQYIEPKPFVIVEGLLPLSTKLARACFDVTVYLDPPESIRREWKIDRDTTKRGYTRAQVEAELDRREPESAAYIRPQRRHADIVVRFSPVPTRDDPPGTPLSAEFLLRPTIQHPSLSHVVSDEEATPMHLKIIRDADGTPVDCLHVHGHASEEDSHMLEKAIWADLADKRDIPSGLGALPDGSRSEPLAITQLILLYHLVQAAQEG